MLEKSSIRSFMLTTLADPTHSRVNAKQRRFIVYLLTKHKDIDTPIDLDLQWNLFNS